MRKIKIILSLTDGDHSAARVMQFAEDSSLPDIALDVYQHFAWLWAMVQADYLDAVSQGRTLIAPPPPED